MKTAFDMNPLAAALKSRMEEKKMKDNSDLRAVVYAAQKMLEEKYEIKEIVQMPFHYCVKDKQGNILFEASGKAEFSKKIRVRIPRLVYWVEEAMLKFEGDSAENTVSYSLGERLADILMDMQDIHDVKWVSKEKYEDMCRRIIKDDSSLDTYKKCMLLAQKEYQGLQTQIRVHKAALRQLRKQKAELLK